MMLLVLVLTMMAGSMAGGLALSSQHERQIAAAHRRAAQLGYASDSAAERCIVTLEMQPVWSDAPGAFVCGAVSTSGDLEARTTALNRSLTSRFPLGADTPQWRLAGTTTSGIFRSAIWIADDPGDGDGAASQDTNGRVILHAETRGIGDALRMIEIHLERRDGVTRRLSWREIW